MKRRSFLLFLLLSFFLISCEQALKPEPGEKHSLWQVKGAQNTVYLLGSIHVGTEDMYPLPPVIMEAFNRSGIMVVELDILNTSQTKLMSGFMYPLGDNLRKNIDQTLYDDIMSLAKELHIPAFTFKRMYPWAVSTTLDMFSLITAGYQADLGIDYYFLKLNAGKKKVQELESPEEQFAAFKSISHEEQIRMLKNSVYSNQNSLDDMQDMVEAWKTGNSEYITAYFNEIEDSGQKGFMEHLLYQRNKGMTDKIKTMLTGREDHFVIVGLGHLCGTGSIIDLLKKAGYTVEQL